MGMIFTTPDTVKLCARLNRRFSDDNLDAIRGKPKRLAKFLDPIHNRRTLARIAYKSGLYPSNNPVSDIAKRWFYFLKTTIPDTVAMDIRQQLLSGLTDMVGSDYKFRSLIFIAFEGPALKFTHEDIDILDSAGVATGYCSKLFKLQTVEIGDDGYDPTQTADPDEDDAHEPKDGPPDP